ncbi:MAG: MBL fold metallo-hydrolase [Candidatus Thalassarchaeaceae archaeon]|jgi:pyrroloquinoline quinone biosynthesis protein B|nr:MBL fold metallo-hydrolase [Candidatus Thalassarchaeaceae archaeon]
MRSVTVTILGIAQDGGFPQPGCSRPCCSGVIEKRSPVSLGIVGSDGSTHLFEASRDLARQFKIWYDADPQSGPLTSLSITHAHLGHVDGIGLFGREAMGASGLTLYCSQTFSTLIEKTPAWRQLKEQGVFIPQEWISGIPFTPSIDCGFTITPIQVPHRDELTDTHALLVTGTKRKLLFMPDHDSWVETLSGSDIRSWLRAMRVDIALIDGTFFSTEEIQHRNISEIPHPTVKESLERLGPKTSGDPEITFIHLNHTNPLLNENSEQSSIVSSLGWSVGQEGQKFDL